MVEAPVSAQLPAAGAGALGSVVRSELEAIGHLLGTVKFLAEALGGPGPPAPPRACHGTGESEAGPAVDDRGQGDDAVLLRSDGRQIARPAVVGLLDRQVPSCGDLPPLLDRRRLDPEPPAAGVALPPTLEM